MKHLQCKGELNLKELLGIAETLVFAAISSGLRLFAHPLVSQRDVVWVDCSKLDQLLLPYLVFSNPRESTLSLSLSPFSLHLSHQLAPLSPVAGCCCCCCCCVLQRQQHQGGGHGTPETGRDRRSFFLSF